MERFDQRIEELASQERYQEKVNKLECFPGIKTHTGLSLIVETGDFARFTKGNTYAAFPGLAPGESSVEIRSTEQGYPKQGTVI